MAEILSYRFLVRGGVESAVKALNEVPLARELVIETDTLKMKLGDGATRYLDLPYVKLGLETSDDLDEGVSNLYFPEAPKDGKQYSRKDGGWEVAQAAVREYQRMTAEGVFRITADGHLRISR